MTTEEVREHLTCSVPDSALQRYIDDAEAEIEYRFGSNSSVTETFDAEQLTHVIYPQRRISSVTEIIERIEEGFVSSYTDTTLSANDYEVINDVRIDRLPTGDNPRNFWGDKVFVTYVPVDKSKQRDRVVVDLVKLAIAYDGVDSQKSGDISMSQSEYTRKREEILSYLGGRWWA